MGAAAELADDIQFKSFGTMSEQKRFAKELKCLCLCQKANAEIIFSMLSENQEPQSPTTVASDASDAES